VSLKIEENKFYGLYGKVGSGKSTFLQAILREIPAFSGKIEFQGKLSYFEQEPIIYSQTLKENIVFGRQFNESRYKDVIWAACLARDLELLENGENTLVGENGLTLSGGQKARVSLARALYEDADLYLFDDPLSAVDAKVAHLIFQRTFLTFLKSKTIILSTHQTHFLTSCNHLLSVENGIITEHNPRALSEQL
jgi:ATP-binding cassette subfamily C (CFTR/MRP) protein 4